MRVVTYRDLVQLILKDVHDLDDRINLEINERQQSYLFVAEDDGLAVVRNKENRGAQIHLYDSESGRQ